MSLLTASKVGKICKEIELKFSTNGKEIAKTSIVFSEKYNGKEKTCFIDVTAFGATAKTLANYFQKGHRIEGVFKLVQETWTAADGTNRSKHALVLERIGEFIEQKQQSQMNMQQPQQQVPVMQENQNGYQEPYNPNDDEIIPF